MKSLLKLRSAGFAVCAFSATPLLADGPADLEALANQAKQAAEKEIAKSAPEKPVAKEALEAAAPAEPETEPAKALDQVVEGAVEDAVTEVTKVVEAADPAKRAESLSLISKISPKATGVFSFSNGAKAWKEAEESEFGKMALEALLENDIDVKDEDSPGPILAALFGEQILLVVGEGTPEQTRNLMELNRWYEKFQITALIELFSGSAGDDLMGGGNPSLEGLKRGLKEDPDFLVNLISALEMPPLLIAAKVSDEDRRMELAMGLQMGVGMLMQGAGELPFLSEAKFESAGIAFQGVNLDAEGLIDNLPESEEMQEGLEIFLDPAAAQDAISSLKTKDLVLASGVSDDAIYIYFGSRAAGVPLVKEGEADLLSSDAFSFVDPYLAETVLGVSWVSEELVGSVYEGQHWLGSSIDGALLGLEEQKDLGDVSKLKTLLTKVSEIEKSIFDAYSHKGTQTISFLSEEGLRSESFGGIIDPAYDLEKPFALGSNAGKSFLTVQTVEDKEAAERTLAYLEAVAAASYEGATIAQENPQVQENMAEFVDYYSLFDESLKGDSIALWNGIRTAEKGFGLETVVEVDLKGTMPTVPNVPEAIIKEGVAPRISVVRSVADPAMVTQSWQEIEVAAGELLKTVGEQMGQNIPMQKPMSSQSDGLTTWFFAIPAQTDDFVPSVTLDDSVAVFSTSKKRAIELGKLAKGEPTAASGIQIDLQFAPLQEFLQGWIELAKENQDTILTNESFAEDFLENQEEIERAVKALDEVESWTAHSRIEDGQLRTSTLLKSK